MTGHESGKSARRTTSRNDHDHGPTAQLLGEAWCITCHHSHIATIPSTTFRCAGDDRPCGFGCWGVTVAAAHADTLPRHIVYPVLHQMVAAHPAPVPAATLTEDEREALDDVATDIVAAYTGGRPYAVVRPDLHAAVERILAARQPATVDAETLAAWLYGWVKKHGGTDLRDTGTRLVLECLCGEPLGISYGPTDYDPNGAEHESQAYFRHQSADLLAFLASAVVPAPEGETDIAAPEGCTCSVDPLDRMPLRDARCPVHGVPLPTPAVPAAVEGVETVEYRTLYAAGVSQGANDAAQALAQAEAPGDVAQVRTRVSYPDRVSEWTPVEPETSAPEGGTTEGGSDE